MKLKFSIPLSIILLFAMACQEENTLVTEPMVYTNSTCNDCPQVFIEYPKAIEDTKLGNAYNAMIEDEIISLLSFSDSLEVSNLNEAIASFSRGYEEIRTVYPDETVPWEARIKAEISFENHLIISIKLDSYIFSGGAHGYSSTQFLNFDATKGQLINTGDLFDDLPAFRSFAESKFRDQEKIPENTSINSTGFMFEQDSFYLPDNIGLTPKGILLMYNQYEVASFADGQIELLLPFKEVKKYVRPGMKL